MKRKLFIAICERNGWDVSEDGSELMIHQFSPAGEDFSFHVSNECDPMEVYRYAEDFDAEEHCGSKQRKTAFGVYRVCLDSWTMLWPSSQCLTIWRATCSWPDCQALKHFA